MTGKHPLSGREIKAKDTPERLIAKALVSDLVYFLNERMLSPAEHFLDAYWSEEKRPISQRSGVREGSLAIRNDSLEKLKELRKEWDNEVRRKVLEFQSNHGYDTQLEKCVTTMDKVMESVTTEQDHCPTKDGKSFRLLTKEELQALKGRWSESKDIYFYHMI
jgi:hypothetical protein